MTRPVRMKKANLTEDLQSLSCRLFFISHLIHTNLSTRIYLFHSIESGFQDSLIFYNRYVLRVIHMSSA